MKIDRTAESAFDVCWARGDSDAKEFLITDAAGAALDISTWSMTMTVNSEKNPLNTDNQLFSLTGAFVTDGTDGRVAFVPTPTQTDVTPKRYFYDVQRTIGGGQVKTLMKGNARIVQDITKT